MKLGVIAANATETFRLTYLPETLLIASTAAPAKVQVRILGEGVTHDNDSTGAVLLNQIRNNAEIANFWEYIIADGLLRGKNVEIEITAGNAATTVYGRSNSSGSCPIYLEKNTILINTQQTFEKFFVLGLSAIGNNDRVTIEYIDGTTDELAADEIKLEFANNSQSKLVIDNLEQTIKKVTVVASQQITVYKMFLK